jgi:hypothetical protein
MSHEECESLPIHRHDEGLISCWEPDADDLARLQAGGKLWLHVVGQGMPPVAISTQHPFVVKARESLWHPDTEEN